MCSFRLIAVRFSSRPSLALYVIFGPPNIADPTRRRPGLDQSPMPLACVCLTIHQASTRVNARTSHGISSSPSREAALPHEGPGVARIAVGVVWNQGDTGARLSRDRGEARELPRQPEGDAALIGRNERCAAHRDARKKQCQCPPLRRCRTLALNVSIGLALKLELCHLAIYPLHSSPA